MSIGRHHPAHMAETDAFVKKVVAELHEMERREQKLHREADSIRQQLAQLRQRRAELDRSLTVYRDVMGVGQEGVAAAEAVEGTIADVAFRVLRENGGPMTIGSLVSELQRLGKLKSGGASGRADYATVYAAIRRDDRFLKVGKGEVSPAPDAPSAPERPS